MKRSLEEEQRARKDLEKVVRRVLKSINDPTWDETNLWGPGTQVLHPKLSKQNKHLHVWDCFPHTHFHGFLSDKTGVCLLGGVLPALISPALPAASITDSVVTFPQCRVDGKKTHLIGSHGWCVPCDDTRTVSALLTTVSSVAVQRYISSTLTITKAWDRTCVVWTWTLPFCNLLCYLSFFFFFFLWIYVQPFLPGTEEDCVPGSSSFVSSLWCFSCWTVPPGVLRNIKLVLYL